MPPKENELRERKTVEISLDLSTEVLQGVFTASLRDDQPHDGTPSWGVTLREQAAKQIKERVARNNPAAHYENVEFGAMQVDTLDDVDRIVTFTVAASYDEVAPPMPVKPLPRSATIKKPEPGPDLGTMEF